MSTAPRWTAAENALLRAKYPNARTTESILELFPGRNVQGLRMQAGRLKIKRAQAPGAWSSAHFAILQAYYPTQGAAYVAQRVGRTADRVRGYAYEHGIRYCQPAACQLPTEKKKPGPQPGAVYKPRARKAPAVAPPKPAKPPVARAEAKSLPLPGVQANVRTPNLNAQKAAVAAKKKEASEKPATYVSADMIRALPAVHPARLAYTRAARQGMPAAQAAYHEAMKQAA